MSEPAALPSFTGLLVYREPTLGYSFLVPDGWQRGELVGAEGTAVLYAPTTPEMFASFSVGGRDLGVEVTSADLPALRAGFLRGLRKLPGARAKLLDASAIGRLISLEAHQTYRDGQAVRKRWVRLLYQGTIQVRLIAQAATVQEFDYWLPMFYESMRTFQFGDWAIAAGVATEDWK